LSPEVPQEFFEALYDDQEEARAQYRLHEHRMRSAIERREAAHFRL